MADFIGKQHSSRNGTTQSAAYTGTSAPVTNAFGSQTRQIRVVANSACHYKIGNGAQTAQTTDPFLSALTIEYVTVNPGESIAAIRGSTDGLVTATSGTIWVTELS